MSYYDGSTCEVSQSIEEPYNASPEIGGASEERQMRTSFSRQARSVKSKQARHASVNSLKLALTTVKRQYSYKTLFFLSLALVLVTVAFTRIASRLSLLTTHFTPLKLPSGLASTRNITSMSMASAKYQKPPQAPPLFTATTESLAKDTRRLLDQSRRIQDQIVKDVTTE